jgi:hypothetical protein
MPLLLFLFSFALFDAEFVQMLLDGDESVWQQLGDETVPPEQDLEILADLADKLARIVPRHFLKEHAMDACPPNWGEVVRLEGRIVSIIKHDTVTEHSGNMSVYRCKMVLNNGGADNRNADNGSEALVFAPSIPQAWMGQRTLNERGAAFGVYIKSSGFSDDRVPVFIAPAIEWYPDTWLGNLGFDVGSFDQVPVSRVTELEQHDDEMNRRMFKFTEADTEPFYGLLRAVAATPEGWLEQEAQKQHTEMPISVTDLFNRPHETRGKPVLLRGTVKRIVPIPVTDSEVLSLFGIDRYYQIYLFTEQSQGNPIVVCVRSLPEGMPTESTADFSEQITVAAIPYKLWIYETASGPHYAPLLIGREPVWHPNPTTKRSPPGTMTTFSYAMFFTLVLLWFACRYGIWLVMKRRRPQRRQGIDSGFISLTRPRV